MSSWSVDRDPREEATRRGKGAGVFQGFGAAELLRWGQALGRRSDGESKGGPETGWWGQTSQAGYATRRSQGKFSQRFTLWGHVARQNAQGPLGCCVENSLEAAGAERGRAPRGRREVERCSRGGGGLAGVLLRRAQGTLLLARERGVSPGEPAEVGS